MAHKKSKKVWWCHQIQHTIMASYCEKCYKNNSWSGECEYGGFNKCKLKSENNQKDIDNALK